MQLVKNKGTFVFMEMEKDDEKINLEKIPSSFPDFAGNEEYEFILLGVIRNINNLLEPTCKNKRFKVGADSQGMMGHYTAICKRQNIWVEIDDITGIQRNLTTEVAKTIFIGLLIYAKISKI